MDHFAKLGLVALCFVIWITFPNSLFAFENLLSNPDFEDFDGDIPRNWTKNYSTLTIAVNSDVHSGSKAVLFQSSSSSTKYLYQILSIVPSQNYQLLGWTKSVSGSSNEYLRVTQCSDPSCTSEIKSDDSEHVQSLDWKNLNLSFTTANNSQAVKIKISLDPQSSAQTSAVWDDLRLSIVSSGPPAPTATSSNTPTTTMSVLPTVDFSLNGPFNVAAPFSILITVNNLPEATYFIKARLGSDESHLGNGETFNSSWLNDTDSWSKFPQITVNNDGKGSGNITAKLLSGKSPGNYKIQIRLKRTDKDTYYLSSLKDIIFNPQVLIPTPTSTIPNNSVNSVPSQKSISSTQRNTFFASNSPEFNFDPNSILGISTISGNSSSSSKIKSVKSHPSLLLESDRENGLQIYEELAVFGGLMLAGLGSTIFIRQYGKRYNKRV